ncbi:unnamed protein product [Linum tenue]|uniref:Uncharacterized protein n=1 Tax=Linum tenue TaxID=586396 RepID=A0AAV0RP51_9ROSI|nr:unnamed protein product [Linum tenue]CAI0559384.1 unnamed protein product [Linum tenue]
MKTEKMRPRVFILPSLRKQVDPIEHRYKESIERGSVIYQLGYSVNSYREAVVS